MVQYEVTRAVRRLPVDVLGVSDALPHDLGLSPADHCPLGSRQAQGRRRHMDQHIAAHVGIHILQRSRRSVRFLKRLSSWALLTYGLALQLCCNMYSWLGSVNT